MNWYCDAALGDPFHQPYHDWEYGFPQTEDAVLLERLALEIFQAGLSWLTILKKREATVAAFHGFDVDTVASFGDQDKQRLLDDPGIIRNRLKVDAIIHNAQIVQNFRETHGSFNQWLAAHHPRKKNEWVTLFKKTFKFTGGEITGEFLMSLGYLPGAHHENCPAYEQIESLSPPWMSVGQDFYRDD